MNLYILQSVKKTSLLFDVSFKRLSKDLTKTRVERNSEAVDLKIDHKLIFPAIACLYLSTWSLETTFIDYLPKYLPKGMIYPPITAGESTANRSPLRYLVTELFDTAIRPRYISRPRPIINKDLGTCSCRVALSR